MRAINWIKKNNTPEKLIEHQIEGYLRMKGYYVQKMQAGSMFVEGRRIKMAAAGTPDIMAFREIYPDGAPNKSEVDLLFVEVKAEKGKVTPLQQAKMEELEGYGARCIVARSIEDLQGEGI